MGRGGADSGMQRMFPGNGRFGSNTPNRESEVELENRMLMKQNQTLRMELDAIMKRLDEMEARTGSTR
jgi:hypothetical protein